MIAGLIGTVHEIESDALLVNVSGVIYRVMTSGRTIAGTAAGDSVALRTHLIVREDAMILYGFREQNELQWFETLIGVTGVGARLACAVLTRFTSQELLEAIAGEQVDLLSTVPGIGKRTASRILLDLRGKLPPDLTAPSGGGFVAPGGAESEVLAALQALGYTLAEARDAVARSSHKEGASVEERVVAALKEIGS